MANGKNKKNKTSSINFFKKLSSNAKIYVIDTNVLIHDPKSLESFDDNGVILPFEAIEELDNLKKGQGEIPYSVRQALRSINSIAEEGKMRGEKLNGGIRTPNGGLLAVYEAKRNYLRGENNDNRIISVAKEIQEAHKGRKVVLVSKDTAVRIKAESIGLNTEDYRKDKSSIFNRYGKLLTEGDYKNGILSARYQFCGSGIDRIVGKDLIKPIRRQRAIMGIAPKNPGQECAMDALTSPDIQIVALTGIAGTGKTLLALAAGLNKTIRDGKGSSPLFEQVMVARPVIPMGSDLGYLPGDISDKLAPWMQPIYDNLEVIIPNPPENGKDGTKKYPNYQYLIDNGWLQIEPLTYIRGRSLPKRYIIIDEAQNLRPLEVKTVVTRCGEGTKIIFTGDLNQIDTPYLDAESNGLAYLISRYINEPEFCYLNLTEGARSSMASKAALLL